MAGDQVSIPYRDGFDYGMGVRSATASPLALGISGAITPVEGAPGGSGGFHLTRVQSNEDLETQLGISAEASAGIGLFSASARFDFVRNCKVQSTSLVLMISATRQKGFQQIDIPALNDEAGKLVSEGKTALFADRYGDAFVRGMHVGGQFFGVFRIDTRSEDSRQRIEASLQGAYGPFAGDAHFHLTETCSREQASIFCDAYWEGGIVTVQPTTPEGLLEAVRQWVDSIDANGQAYSVTLAPYVIANGPLPPNGEDLRHQRDVLTQCARVRSQTYDRMNLVEYIIDPLHSQYFDIKAPPAGPDLAALHAGLSADLDMIAQAASWAEDHPKEALEPETFARTKKGQPNYKLTILPANMPKHSGATVIVPDFFESASQRDAGQLAAANRLNIHWVYGDEISESWHVLSQNPPKGALVNAGTTVTVTTSITRAQLMMLEQAGIG